MEARDGWMFAFHRRGYSVSEAFAEKMKLRSPSRGRGRHAYPRVYLDDLLMDFSTLA